MQRLGATAVLARFDRVIIHTEQARPRLAAYGVDAARVQRIAHGFLDDSAPVPPPAPITDGRPVRFLLFGKIKPYKGIDLMIEAVKRLAPETRARIEVLVVGKPYMDVAPLQAAAAEVPQIRFEFRFVPDEEMPSLFAWADVLAFPYREIEMSGVLMAALKTARPMVASNIGGFAELLTDGATGFLVEPGDVVGLAQAITRLVEEPAMRARMTQGLIDLVQAIPSWDRIAADTEDLYAAVIAERAMALMGQTGRGAVAGDLAVGALGLVQLLIGPGRGVGAGFEHGDRADVAIDALENGIDQAIALDARGNDIGGRDPPHAAHMGECRLPQRLDRFRGEERAMPGDRDQRPGAGAGQFLGDRPGFPRHSCGSARDSTDPRPRPRASARRPTG